VAATTAIALMMMSSGTPASRIAATRCPATRGEVIMADSEAGVGLVKRASVVVCRAAEHLRYQEHLVAPKSRKIDPFEVRCKLRIAQNALIKIVHDSAYGGSAADDVVVTQAPASRLVTHACSSFRVADVANKFTFTCHV
jgi:hypothetical protein